MALGLRLVLIKPYGFDLSEKAVRRAGLDYWKHVDIAEYENWDDFLENEKPENDQLYFFSKNPEQNYFQADYKINGYLIFGSETKGLPQHIFDKYPQRMFSLPMFSEHVRSLNLSNVATTAAYEALRQINLKL